MQSHTCPCHLLPIITVPFAQATFHPLPPSHPTLVTPPLCTKCTHAYQSILHVSSSSSLSQERKSIFFYKNSPLFLMRARASATNECCVTKHYLEESPRHNPSAFLHPWATFGCLFRIHGFKLSELTSFHIHSPHFCVAALRGCPSIEISTFCKSKGKFCMLWINVWVFRSSHVGSNQSLLQRYGSSLVHGLPLPSSNVKQLANMSWMTQLCLFI